MENSFTSQFVIALAAFVLGWGGGYFTHDFMKRFLNMDENFGKNFLMVIVTCVWAISVIVDLASPAYEVPLPLHTIMGVIVGFFFYRPRDKNGK